MKYITTLEGEQFEIDINENGRVTFDGQVIDVDMVNVANTSTYSVIIDGMSFDVTIDEAEELYHVMMKGGLFEVTVEDEQLRRLAGLKGGFGAPVGEVLIKAPMPGVIVDVPVEAGQGVSKGDIVVILESMKMQNEFKAPRQGTVHEVRVRAGDRVEQNAIMVTIS
ncbi:MAG: biotin/lipoyl-containing protein [Anaerolineae bacterium]